MTEAAAPARLGTVTVRAMRDADATAVLAIYQAGIDTGEATFETRAPDWAGFTAGRRPRTRSRRWRDVLLVERRSPAVG